MQAKTVTSSLRSFPTLPSRLLKNCLVHGTYQNRTGHKSDSKRVSSGLFHQPARCFLLPGTRSLRGSLCPIFPSICEIVRNPKNEPRSCYPLSKYGDGLPLYRQEAIYLRDSVEVSRNLMAQCMGHLGFELQICADYILERVKEGERVLADERTIPTLAPGSGR